MGIGVLIVDDQPLHDVDAIHVPGQIGESGRQRCFLVEARDLNDQLERAAGHCRHVGRKLMSR